MPTNRKIKKKYVRAYTDGSLIKKHDRIQCGYGICFPEKEFDNIGKPFTHAPITNNRAELYAIYKAIKLFVKHYDFEHLQIFTDSEYCVKSLTIWIHSWIKNDWKSATRKPVENQDIIKKIYAYLLLSINKIIGKIELTHVYSHTKNDNSDNWKYNDCADALAKHGSNLSN